MKHLIIICFLVVAIVSAYKTSNATSSLIRNADQNTEAQLRLSTSILEQQYSVEAGSRFLRLLLNLTYSNTGSQPILLDKKSSLVYRKLVSRSLKAASQKGYEYDETSSFVTVGAMQAAGMRLESPPDREAFITLKRGESYDLKTEIILKLYDGTSDSEGSLRPGSHFLQIRVATWYYFPDVDSYREKWRNDGYLWSHDITSVPMPFTVKQRP